MTPKDAFDNTISRATALLALHDGLVDIRRRGMRSDWKRSFCRLMHWPLGCSIARVDSVDAVIVLRDGASLTEAAFATAALDDLLRSSLVMAVSALDRYVHERICKEIVTAFKRPGLLREQQEFSVPLKLALTAIDSLRRAQRANRAVRPANEIRKAVQEMLHARPFQSWREIEYGFRLIGISKMGGSIQASLGLPDITPFKKQLETIVSRRHRIVHEGDLKRHQRGGRPQKNEITPATVRSAINFLNNFVSELDKL